jgi:hypothetical protein
MKFILNFIFFGILFYVIWVYFPEAFNTLVSWAHSVFDFLKDLIVGIIDKISPGHTGHEVSPNPTSPTPPPPQSP